MQLLLALFAAIPPDTAENGLDPGGACYPGVLGDEQMIPETREMLALNLSSAETAGDVDALEVLYAPLDVDRAYRLHRANCGPASFAALFGRDVCEVMGFFPGFRAKPVTNIPRMHAALRGSGVSFRREARRFPSDGLVLIQVEGPWTAASRAAFDAPRHRHWVSVRLGYVYEVNLESWVPRQVWEEDYLPALVARHSGATGWSVSAVFELEAAGRVPDSVGESYALRSISGRPCRKRR